ncbi:MAG: carboxylesterase family protein, partial [Eubacteriales bacterium]
QAQPYIAKGIVMSGGPVWMHNRENAQEVARDFMEFMRIKSLEDLRSLPADTLVAKQKKFLAHSKHGQGSFSIVVDGDMVMDFPIPASQSGACADIPVLIGNTKEELSFTASKWLSKVMVVRDIAFGIFWSEPRQIRNRITAVYQKYGRKAQGMMISDYVFKITSLWLAQARNAFADTWMYRFDYAPALLKMVRVNAVHSVDISFLFGNHSVAPSIFMFLLPAVTKIRRITNELQGDFTTFAKTGKLPWPKCEGKTTPAMCYNTKCRVEPMIDPAIVDGHKKSEFKRKCFAGIPIV